MATAGDLPLSAARPAPSDDAAGRRFRRWGWATVALVYLLIAAGAIVRASGSGMGCPDWPKCFGLWVPPTHASQLPADYATRFAIPGHVPEFNAVKTWVEYVNRLLGALTGLAIVGVVVAAMPLWNVSRTRVLAAGAALLLVAFNGWLGSRVVATVLAPGLITLHMVAAVGVVAALLVAVVDAPRDLRLSRIQGAQLLGLAWVGAALALTQLVIGTQVRESVDAQATLLGETRRAEWLAGVSLTTHQLVAWLTGVVALLSLLWALKHRPPMPLRGWMMAPLALVAVNVSIGLILSSAFPAWAQPLHLLTGTLLVGAQVVVLRMALSTSPSSIPHVSYADRA